MTNFVITIASIKNDRILIVFFIDLHKIAWIIKMIKMKLLAFIFQIQIKVQQNAGSGGRLHRQGKTFPQLAGENLENYYSDGIYL